MDDLNQGGKNRAGREPAGNPLETSSAGSSTARPKPKSRKKSKLSVTIAPSGVTSQDIAIE